MGGTIYEPIVNTEIPNTMGISIIERPDDDERPNWSLENPDAHASIGVKLTTRQAEWYYNFYTII